MELKLYLNKETLRLLRIGNPSQPTSIKLLPIEFSRTDGNCYKIAFTMDNNKADYKKLYQLYEPFQAKTASKYDYAINEVEIVPYTTGVTIWYIPCKFFARYFERFKVSASDANSSEEDKNGGPEETI